MRKYIVTLKTTYSNYAEPDTPIITFFKKEFEVKKEARSFFRKFAKENNFKNTVYPDEKLGWYEDRQVELTIV
ncbi:hypothetical protein [Capnocytophaga sp.]|uniref:hypothetical protein n=1 Tax=Capnocytophaga sp. TaxID=44737 RepID=UPI0026DB58AB|nr:hypothetical protein [Capnocytophaga sp.]MDO5106045.1 hypothetical protein [Capnocytophaga sp.]